MKRDPWCRVSVAAKGYDLKALQLVCCELGLCRTYKRLKRFQRFIPLECRSNGLESDDCSVYGTSLTLDKHQKLLHPIADAGRDCTRCVCVACLTRASRGEPVAPYTHHVAAQIYLHHRL